MTLHIIGHSMTIGHHCHESQSNRNLPTTFSDMLIEKYRDQFDVQVHSYRQCSEERILQIVRTIKSPIDKVIIFHSHPSFVYFPSFDRDIGCIDDIEYIQSLDIVCYYNYCKPGKPFDPNDKLSRPISGSEFVQIYKTVMNYTVSADVSQKRFNGAILQIDQLLTVRKIPVIHCPMAKTLPVWFNFSSGITDNELSIIDSGKHNIGYQRSLNAIDNEGNTIIFNKLSEYIDNLT
jgi:hypothetical protein